jgi:hypothetical protein
LLCRHSSDLNLKIYYKSYCTVLSKVTLAVKKLHYNKIILGSKNKMKSAWKIINEEKGKTKNDTDIQALVINNNVMMNQNKIANIFNDYFLSVADTSNSDNNKHMNTSMTNVINYLTNNFKRPFPKISWQYASTLKLKELLSH